MSGGSFVPDLATWDAWHPDEVAARLRGLGVPWAIAAGWAIDLHVGGEPRRHDDVEIAIARSSFDAVRTALPELEWFGAGNGRVWPVDDEPPGLHQTWGRDRAGRSWRLEVFREPWDEDEWVWRRDPSIRRPVAGVIERTPGGVPYLAPEVVLLFKAKAAREKDESDLARVLPALRASRRRWLAQTLRIVHPGHAWIRRVELGS